MREESTLYLDGLKLDQMKDMEIDQEVTVVIRGRVRSVSKREIHDYPMGCCESPVKNKKQKKEKKTTQGTLELDYKKSEISFKGGNEFANLAEDDD